ncbi:MAG: sigma-70 family RNA polymerase sigma factor [Chromatiales bacterium]|nr:sigma-70 family RNA polymerase sigma factor [Chromatiales bacterium]
MTGLLGQQRAKRRRFEAITRAWSTDLFRFAFWLCRDRELAEDLTQETFLRAWRALDTLDDDKAAKAWLITILRREYARQFERLRPVLTEIDEQVLPAANSDYDTSTEAFVLRRALARLDEDYRLPLLLQVIGGFTCAEIATQLGLSESAAVTRVFRAKRKLREALGERWEEDETRD